MRFADGCGKVWVVLCFLPLNVISLQLNVTTERMCLHFVFMPLQGAKARVEIMQKNPVNEALYNCTGITCTSTRLCHTLDCAWGRCMDEARAENMPDGTACDDGNPLTPDDECGNGFCAGTDDYWFTVLVNATTPLSTGAMSLSQEDGVANSIQTCSGVSGFTYVSDVISSPLLATVNFSLPTYREFGANALDDSLLQCVGTLLSFRGSTCSVEDIPFVSETETPAPTQAPTTAAPTDTPTSSAPTQVPTDRPTIQPTVTGGTFFPTTASPTKPGDTLAPSTLSPTTVAQGLPSSSNKESSFTSSVYFYGAAGAAGLVVLVVLICCCCCRKGRSKNSSPVDPRRNTTSDGRLPMHENPMYGSNKTYETETPAIESGKWDPLNVRDLPASAL
eukprot:m.489122 g.489122  ORF g.489122 m.489122 type:complete len:391 (+) comp21763_c2_seq22:945-2117(+)